jgi:hypothetical protein
VGAAALAAKHKLPVVYWSRLPVGLPVVQSIKFELVINVPAGRA